jgi:predicted nucleic acid-binding protein
MIVLDTDVLSFLMRATPPLRLVRRFASIPIDQQATTAINLGELVYGAMRMERSARLLEEIQTVKSDLVVLPFDGPAAEVYGRLRADLANKRQILAEPDLRIAAICLCHDAELATGNLKHFERIQELKVSDWLADVRPASHKA